MTRAAASRRAIGAYAPPGSRQARSRALALWVGWVLALAVVLAPALGRMHQLVHGPAVLGQAAGPVQGHGHAHGTRPGAGPAAADGASAHSHPPGVLEALFAGHAGSDCTLLDHSLIGAALLPALLPVAAPATAPAPHEVPATGIGARPPRTSLARAPPTAASTSA